MDLAEIQESPKKALELIQQLTGTVEKRDAQIEQLKDELRLALHRKFGRSSEKIDPSQKDMFEEDTPSVEELVPKEQISVPPHRRTKAGRKPLDPSIPREDIIHDIPEEEKLCRCGHMLVKVDEVISERLKHIPEQIYVERHIRPKYACKNCEGS